MIVVRQCLFLILLCLSTSIFYTAAQAYDFSPRSSAQVAKEAQRWSLSQWMEQKGKIQWMDLWLNTNTKSPSYYEIYIGADYSLMERSVSTDAGPATLTEDITSRSGHLGLFVSIFGLYTRYEKSSDSERTSWENLAQLRLLGSSDQGSNLTLFYGFKDLNLSLEKSNHQQAGGYLNLYLLKAWAIQGRYAQILESNTSSGAQLSGHRIEATTWLEWGPLRFFGTWYKEPLEQTLGNTTTETSFEGYSIGIRTYLDFKK